MKNEFAKTNFSNKYYTDKNGVKYKVKGIDWENKKFILRLEKICQHQKVDQQK